jgi:transcriptional regulator with PAS, ATPase and Fis domain
VRHIPTGIWQQLYQHHWPGNVRELRNVIERCVLFAEGEEFPREWLRLGTPDRETPLGPAQADGNWLRLPLDGSMALEDMDRIIIQNALERNECNVMATARALKTTRETVRYRISKYHLKVS